MSLSLKNLKFIIPTVLGLSAVLAAVFYFGLNQELKATDCSRAEVKTQCWRDLVLRTFEKEGLAQSLNLADAIYREDPEFMSVCHDIGHLLGKETYKIFEAGEDFEISPKTALCSYGFYHGLMGEMARNEGDLSRVRDFCDYVDIQISKQTPDATLQCFHGIGHGWVNVHDAPELWGDEAGIVEKGLSLCEKVSEDEDELSRCATGVFNGLAFFYIDREYNLEPDPNDPLKVCRVQKEIYKDPCYISLNVLLMSLAGGDLAEAARFIEVIPEADYAYHAMLNLAAAFASVDIESPAPRGAAACREVAPSLIKPCVQGYAFAFLEHGEPGVEYVKAIDFCSSPVLSPDEKKSCQEYIFNYLPQWYAEDKARTICQGLVVEDRDFCLETVESRLQTFKQ